MAHEQGKLPPENLQKSQQLKCLINIKGIFTILHVFWCFDVFFGLFYGIFDN